MVWNFPNAPSDCVTRYGGITTGMWVVDLNHF
jgi:hypothetical protein